MPNNARVHYGTGKLAAVLYSIRVEITPSENPVIYYGVHISLATCLYLAFCDRVFEESSDTLHCNTEKDKSCLVKLHERSAGIYYFAKLIVAAWI